MKILFHVRVLAVAGMAALILGAGGSCSPADSPEETSVPGGDLARKKAAIAASYPLKTELTNNDGEVIQVTVIGRTDKDVLFTKDGDTKEISYPLVKLSKQDRRRIGAMPVGAGPKPEPPYVASRRKAIEDNLRRIREAEAELEGASIINTTANMAAKQRKIEELEKENTLLESQIKNYSGK